MNDKTLLSQQVAATRQFLTANGSKPADKGLENTFLSMESASKVDFKSMDKLVNEMDVKSFSSDIRKAEEPVLSMLGFETTTPEEKQRIEEQLFTMNAQQARAAALIMLAHGNPVEYAKQARSMNISTTPSGREVDSSNFVMMAADSCGCESEELVQLSYDQKELRDMMPYSVVFNVKASRLSRMGNELYNTIVLAPNQIGYDVSFRRPLVFNHLRRNADGTPADWVRRPLLDAFMYNDVLSNDVTDLHPIYRADDANAQYFVDKTIVAPRDIEIKGVTYKTSYLAVDKLIDMIGIAEDDSILANGYSDNTDALDAQITLTKILVEIKSTKHSKTSYVPFDVSGLITNGFQKSLEGDFRKMTLAFDTHSIFVDENTVDVKGAKAEALQDIIDSKSAAQLAIEVYGSSNVEKAGLRVNGANAELYRLVDQDNIEQPRKSEEFKQLAEDLSFKLVGYELRIRRNNSNRRERGKHLDFNMKQERYAIGLLAPFSIPRPLDWEENAADLDVLIQAANARFDNLMVEKLFSYKDALKAVATSRFRQFGDIQIEGFGRYLIRPWFEEINLDLEKSVQGTTTAERRAEVSAAIMNVIREMAYRMYSESGYQPALQLLSSNADEKPRCVVATDNYIPQFLQTDGDFRTVGVSFNFVVVDNPNVMLRDKIFVTLSRGIQGSPDPLTFGMFLYVPELVSVAQVTRNGQVSKETMVQPRCRFVNNCPLLGLINVVNLRKVYTENIKLPVQTN